MLGIFTKLADIGLFGLLAYSACLLTKIIVTAMICRHSELSEEKVKSITKMVSKDSFFRFLKSN